MALNYMQTSKMTEVPKKPQQAAISFEIRLDATATAADSRAAYDDIYDLDDISQSDSFYLWIQDLLALKPGESYLDISCGRAQLTTLARQQGAQAHGLDLSYMALRSGWNAGQGGESQETAKNCHMQRIVLTWSVISAVWNIIWICKRPFSKWRVC